MRLAQLFTAWFLTALVLSFGGPGVVAQAERAGPSFDRAPAVAEIRAPEEYVCGKSLFGPKELSSRPPFDSLFSNYERPTSSPECRAFFDRWGYFDGQGNERWSYPENNGFEGAPSRLTISPGMLVDRFGGSSGSFLAPAGTPYRERSLPPTNLNTPPGGPQHSYHVYRVIQPFDVDAGPSAEWFSQPGGGLQYFLNPAYKPTDDAAPYNVDYLLERGILEEVEPK